ncbi:MAG: acyl--CoA ligase [bacterium]|nr:acyl--CoA ligase [bacterium]
MRVSSNLDLPCGPARLTLGFFLSDIAAIHGGRVALTSEGHETTYRELETEARHLARGLIGAGVVKGARVAVQMANRHEWIISAFATALVGGVLVPVNTFAKGDERDYILRHSDASLLILQPSLLGRDLLCELFDDHPELATGEPGRLRCLALPQLRRVVCLGDEDRALGVQSWQSLHECGADVSDALLDAATEEVHPSDDGLIIYTSGTSAKPKGVLHTQRAPVIQSYRLAEYLRLSQDDRVLTAQPFFWTAGIVWSLGATLAAGGRMVLQETFVPVEALDLIEAERVNVLHAWSHQEKLLAEHPTTEARDLSCLRKIEFTSLLAPVAGLEEDAWGAYSAYGTTETFTMCSMLPADAPAQIRHATHGRALPGMRLRIVDPESGAELGPNSPGEIAVKGVTLMRGYYKVEREAFLDDSGFFRTRDGGRIDERGYLHWTGRLSDMIKTGGANVSPVEIEAALADCPGLRAGLAVGIPHPSLGEVVILCALPNHGSAPPPETIRNFLRERLATYKVPRHILFFDEDEIGFTGSQKIQIGPLREEVGRRLAEANTAIEGFVYGGGDDGALRASTSETRMEPEKPPA